jgi:hypothetical protein
VKSIYTNEKKQKLMQIEAKIMYERTPTTLHMNTMVQSWEEFSSILLMIYFVIGNKATSKWQKIFLILKKESQKSPILPSYESCNFVGS